MGTGNQMAWYQGECGTTSVYDDTNCKGRIGLSSKGRGKVEEEEEAVLVMIKETEKGARMKS